MQGPSSVSGNSPSPNEIVAEGRNFKRVGLFDELMVGRFYFLIGAGHKKLVSIFNKGLMPDGEKAVKVIIYKTWGLDHWADVAGDSNPLLVRESTFDAGVIKMYYMEQRGPAGGRRKSRHHRRPKRKQTRRRRQA